MQNGPVPSLHIIQHVPFEPAGILPDLAKRHGWTVSVTEQFAGSGLPDVASIDRIIVMGGPMGTADEKDYPFLKAEKSWIRAAIAQNVPVLGICLGAQLLAEALGAEVLPARHKEIGFFPVTLTQEARKSRYFHDFPDRFTPLHWHGQTFTLPPGALHIARSEACEQQAFEMGPHIGLQFHLEMTADVITGLIKHAGDELIPSPWVMNESQLKEGINLLSRSEELMQQLINRWLA